MDLEKIGNFIRQMRNKKKLTQQELANKLGVTDRAISNWENGRRMPDVSIYKKLCHELEISVNELISGEKITNEKITEDIVDESIIKTLNYGEKGKKKLNKVIKILLILLCILIIFIGIFFYSYRKHYPKINIYKIKTFENQEEKLVDQLIPIDDAIMYYSLDYVLLCDLNDRCYNLLTALYNKQTNIKKIKKFLDSQNKDNNLQKFKYHEDDITIYKNDSYEVIFCNNTNQIYFGKMYTESKLQGKYCGINEDIKKEFIRTYKIESITSDNNGEYKNVALSQFQSDIVLVKIPSKFNLQSGKNYEFTFETYEIFKDTIEDIFKYSNIKEVNITNKLGLEQIQQPIYMEK